MFCFFIFFKYESFINSLKLSSQIHHFLDFVKQIYKDLPKVVVSQITFKYVFGCCLLS